MYNFDRQIHAEIEWGYYMYLLDEYVGERAKAMNNRLTNEFESAELEKNIKNKYRFTRKICKTYFKKN